MTGPNDWLLAAAAGRAAVWFTENAQLGQLLWAIEGARCYERRSGDDLVVTLVCPDGARVVHEYVGVELGVSR